MLFLCCGGIELAPPLTHSCLRKLLKSLLGFVARQAAIPRSKGNHSQ